MRPLVLGLVGGLFALATAAGPAAADAPAPAGFTVVPDSRSPDGEWQVVIPSLAAQDGATPPPCETRLVNVHTGALVGKIPGECFFEHQGQSHLVARWSADSHTLVWQADNKWGTANVQILEVSGGKITSAFDARPPAEDHVLAAIRAASPRQYKTSQEHGKGNGAWFRDGFSIDVRPRIGAHVTFPIAFTVDVTSDPKCMWPGADRAGGTLTATLDAAHKWTFTAFVAGHKGCGAGGLECQFSDCD